MADKRRGGYNKVMEDDFSLLEASAEIVAPRLLGCYLVRELDGQQLMGEIVETEAYDQADAASHSYRGDTLRTRVMFGPPGLLYVYFTYGMHYCANVVVGQSGHGAAVLIRAIAPLVGTDLMSQLRHGITDEQLTNGPAKLCYALGIDKTLNGHDLRYPPLQLLIKPSLPPHQVVTTTRIGITRDAHRPWRFYNSVSPFVSKR